jgi:competence protein ComEC
MLATVGLLRLSGRRWPWPHVWLLTCAVVVAVDPWALLQAGFWLSFVAVGILFASDSGATNAVRTGARGRFSSMFREQGVITLALTPLTLLLFGQVSVPDGHFKFPHLWPVKFPQAGRLNYQSFGLTGSDLLSW